MTYNNTIIISAVNFIEGGPLSILKKCVQELSVYNADQRYEVIVLVNSKNLLHEYDNVTYIEYSQPKKNWFFRVFYEYVYFFFVSLKYKPLIWLSLHDTTPNVRAKYRYVYMHNPSPFYEKKKGEKLIWKFRLFVSFYKFLYRLNVKRNTSIIVQQDWFRSKISDMFKINKDKIIVAYPEFTVPESPFYDGLYNKHTFFFNSFPREFKNFEVICQAADILNGYKDLGDDWNVYLTIDGTENVYSRFVVDKYRNNPHIHFIGLVSREKCEEYYKTTEVLIFPSRLETWGLPISEYKVYGKKMILADLPYAHETANGAKEVKFFDPTNAEQLAEIMNNVITGCASFFSSVPKNVIMDPFCTSWAELFRIIIK